MKLNTLLFALFLFPVVLASQVSMNVEVIKQFDRGSTSYSGSWIYTNQEGVEYGLVGSASGVAIYPLEVGNDEEAGFVLGPTSRWREITVIGDYAYVTTEGNGENEGLQVLSLGGLPDTAFLVTTFDSTFTRGHILQKDIFNPDEPFIYVSGTDSTGGVHILDVSDPMNPTEIGRHDPPEYIHDVHVRGDRMYTFQFSAGIIEIIDISDKTNPTLLATIDDPGANTHSGWTTEDNNFLLVADERNGFDGRVFDIRDLDNITEVSTFTSNPETFVHNPYVLGDFAYLAHNKEGIRIYDVLDPSNPIEVGFYDTVTEDNPDSGGLWSACPYIPSGKVIGGDRDLGLVVWEVNEVYASRFSGTVLNASTLDPLNDVLVEVLGRTDSLATNAFGAYKSGFPEEGLITLRFSKDGFQDVLQTVNLVAQEDQVNQILMEQAVSTRNTLQNNLVKIWPNPVDQIINIDVDSELNNILVGYELYAQDGKLVKFGALSLGEKHHIDVNDLLDGNYIVNLLDLSGKIKASKQVVVLH